MAFTGFPAEAFEFYEGLLADNSRTYWSTHKGTYDEAVRAPMLALAAELEPEFGEAKLFRPNRDVRFSADKSPYKTHQGLYCQLAASVGAYLQIDAEGLYTAGGFHAPERELTRRFRAAVDNPAAGPELERIVAALAKAGFTIGGERVRTRPRGCPADHPRLDLMRHESLTAGRRYAVGPRLGTRTTLDLVRSDWRALRPLTAWLDHHLA